MPLLQGVEAKYGIEKIGFMPLLQGTAAKYGIGRIGFMPLLQGVEAKYGIIFRTFLFCLINSFFGKNVKNLNFHD